MVKIRRTQEQWQQLIEGQPKSGLSIKAYCAQHHLTVSGFYQWRKKLNGDSAAVSAPADWLSFNAPTSPSSGDEWQIELSLPGGVVLRMNNTTG